ncbi:MAG: HigA family addiction module antidote protein, partial [Chitinivibrionia bacterium]|nr:HigA family addiction module antidote protein [Chitinivibrionia bacterium]
MTTEMAIHSDLAIPPGEYLEEVIDELGMTKDELATRMARPASKLSPIFKGDKAITPDTALQLEKVVGVPAHIWLGLESEYRLTLARQQAAGEQVGRQQET